METSLKYKEIKKRLLHLSNKRELCSGELKSLNRRIEELVEEKWAIERSLIPVKIIPTRNLAGHEGRKKSGRRKQGTRRKEEEREKLDPIILAELAKRRKS